MLSSNLENSCLLGKSKNFLTTGFFLRIWWFFTLYECTNNTITNIVNNTVIHNNTNRDTKRNENIEQTKGNNTNRDTKRNENIEQTKDNNTNRDTKRSTGNYINRDTNRDSEGKILFHSIIFLIVF